MSTIGWHVHQFWQMSSASIHLNTFSDSQCKLASALEILKKSEKVVSTGTLVQSRRTVWDSLSMFELWRCALFAVIRNAGNALESFQAPPGPGWISFHYDPFSIFVSCHAEKDIKHMFQTGLLLLISSPPGFESSPALAFQIVCRQRFWIPGWTLLE